MTAMAGALLANALIAADAEKTLKLTEANSGQVVSALVGSLIQVDLAPAMTWSEVGVPDSSSAETGEAVLKKLSSSTPEDGGSHAVFRVTRAGHVALKAKGRAKCEARQPCPMFMLQWSVLLTVPDPL